MKRNKSNFTRAQPTARPKLLIICGLSFAEKSTLGHAISKRFGYAEVDVDNSKVNLHGPMIKANDLTTAQWKTIYQRTDREIEAHLSSDQSVVDASRHFRRAERYESRVLATKLCADFITIHVDTPESVARERRLGSSRKQMRWDVSDADFEDIVAAMEPPALDESALIFHFSDDIEQWLSDDRDIIGTFAFRPWT
jgi:predicted kinase